MEHHQSASPEKLTATPYTLTKVSSWAELWECSLTGYKSLHAATTLRPSNILAPIGFKEVLKEPNYLSVQLGDEQHILLEPEYLQYINHSCNPNVFFNTTNMLVTCLRRIEIGEEIVFFYPSTEWSMEQAFDCCCDEGCLGRIQGAAHLNQNILERYQISKYIRQKLNYQE